jgi:hypothetical protein
LQTCTGSRQWSRQTQQRKQGMRRTRREGAPVDSSCWHCMRLVVRYSKPGVAEACCCAERSFWKPGTLPLAELGLQQLSTELHGSVHGCAAASSPTFTGAACCCS